MLKNVYGIDVGNYDTKSATTTVPSGYTKTTTLPTWEKKYLFLNGEYYIPSTTRLPFVKDKTGDDADDRCLILSCMAIGSETLARMEKRKIEGRAAIQEAISKITTINIGAGLPPRYMSKEMADKNVSYYQDKMGKGIEFTYNGYQFAFALKNVGIYPQGLLPSVLNKNAINTEYKSYYGIDIGGYTVDVLYISNMQSDFEKTRTKEMGVIPMYNAIIDKVMIENGTTIDYNNIEEVLKGEKTVLPENIKNTITSMTHDWLKKIINTLRQDGIELKTYPSIFSGGGSLLLSKEINNSNMIAAHTIIEDVHANALCYQKIMQTKQDN